MNLSEVVNRVIDLGGKIRDYYDAELPKYYRNYPLESPGEKDPPPPPEEMELREYLGSLPDDLIYQLLLVMYLGREEPRVDDLAGYFQEVKSRTGTPDNAKKALMLSDTIIADQLTDGLEWLDKHKIKVNQLPLKKIKPQKR